MRIVHVMEATIGGTRRHLVDLARGQKQAGLDVHVVASAERTAAFRGDLRALADLGVGVFELPMLREIRPATDLRHARALGGLFRQLAPDIVHTHSSKAGALGRLASIGARRGRRVHTPHTFAFLFGAMFSPGKRRLFRAIESALGRCTQRVVAVSRSEAETIVHSGVIAAQRVRVVQNGIDPAPFRRARPLARASLGIPAQAPLGAVVGLLNRAKGQDLALEALARPEARELHLVFAGEGEDRAALEAQAARLGVAARAHFLGWRDDVPALLASCDLLVLPSRWEGMPYIVLEAFAAGLPVVATRVDGARELVEEGKSGALCALEDPAELAQAIARVLAAGAAGRKALGRAGQQLVEAELTVDRMVAKLTEVYREAL